MASRTQNYIFIPLNGLRTTYCGLRTTYLLVENCCWLASKDVFFALMDSKLHIHGFKTTYFDYFADSKLHIADSKLPDFDIVAHKPCGKVCISLKENTLALFCICGKHSEFVLTNSKLLIRVAFRESFCKSSVSLVSLHNFPGKRRVRRKYEFRIC